MAHHRILDYRQAPAWPLRPMPVARSARRSSCHPVKDDDHGGNGDDAAGTNRREVPDAYENLALRQLLDYLQHEFAEARRTAGVDLAHVLYSFLRR